MPALYPMTVAPEDFQVGDCVRKFVTEWNVTPFLGRVTHVVPSTYKVWVQWPIEHSQESPETLIKVNPSISGMPTVSKDTGYSSYEKTISEKFRGRLAKNDLSKEKMAIRIAHTFATKVIGKLVDDIIRHQEAGLSEVQTYNRVYSKYARTCSDHIMRTSIERIYQELKKEHE